MTRYGIFVLLMAGYSLAQLISSQERLPFQFPSPSRVLTVEMQIVDAAMRNGIPPQRALARAWNESKYQDVDSACCRSVMQLHKRLWPKLSVAGNIDAGVRHLAGLVRRYPHGVDAETVYRKGHL